MPLVFAENEFTESGIRYADETGRVYQFPQRYRKLIQPGEQFVYYRGRKKLRGRQVPVYFGSGVVGAVDADSSDKKRLICKVLQYQPFEVPVPFKSGADSYLEKGGKRRGYFQPGVRRISAEEHSAILERAVVVLESIAPVTHKNADVDRSVWRMAKTAAQTTEFANGQTIEKKIKDKKLDLAIELLAKHIAELIDKQKGKCALSGLPLEFDSVAADKELLCSLDRIDSNAHYSIGNLQIVCRFLNRWKSNGDDAEFRRLLFLLRPIEKLA